jgi:hypothetical protein
VNGRMAFRSRVSTKKSRQGKVNQVLRFIVLVDYESLFISILICCLALLKIDSAVLYSCYSWDACNSLRLRSHQLVEPKPISTIVSDAGSGMITWSKSEIDFVISQSKSVRPVFHSYIPPGE